MLLFFECQMECRFALFCFVLFWKSKQAQGKINQPDHQSDCQTQQASYVPQRMWVYIGGWGNMKRCVCLCL